jgi:hypothetical protein
MPNSRTKKINPNQATPERAAGGAQAGERGLVELDVAVLLALDDHNVIELEVVALDGFAEVRRHLLRRRQILVRDRDQITRAGFLPVLPVRVVGAGSFAQASRGRRPDAVRAICAPERRTRPADGVIP